jgi:hypothetical protein
MTLLPWSQRPPAAESDCMGRAGRDLQGLAVEPEALYSGALRRAGGARPEAGQRRGRVEGVGPDLNPSAKPVAWEREVRVIARVDEYPVPALEPKVL